jgi:hypothetical protein
MCGIKQVQQIMGHRMKAFEPMQVPIGAARRSAAHISTALSLSLARSLSPQLSAYRLLEISKITFFPGVPLLCTDWLTNLSAPQRRYSSLFPPFEVLTNLMRLSIKCISSGCRGKPQHVCEKSYIMCGIRLESVNYMRFFIYKMRFEPWIQEIYVKNHI